MDLKIIGYIHSDLPDKFGSPRQAGIVKELTGYIEISHEYCQAEAFNGLEEFEYIWVLFLFHKAIRNDRAFNATVKPPKLGGNVRKGVFATRSPFRPNNIGLSSLKLEGITHENNQTILKVSGVDLIDNTPIIDIKPYLPYTDSHADAKAGFSDKIKNYKLEVSIADDLLSKIPLDKQAALIALLSEDPRPGYQHDSREYGLFFNKYNVRFTVNENIVTVTSIRLR